VAHGCYRGSRPASAVSAMLLATHRVLGTWKHAVDRYIALTEFARRKLVNAGLPAEKVVVKPNFVAPDPGPSQRREKFALFVGRLSQEKGITTLLESWRALAAPVRLKIAGDGPMAGEVAAAAHDDARIEWLGPLPPERVTECMKRASVLVFPSIWYEGLPLTILEAYATGLPVVASDLGSMAEIVADDTGMRFGPGDPTALARQIEWCWVNPGRLQEMGRRARQTFESNYTAESNYRRLTEIYEFAASRSSSANATSTRSGQPQCSCIPDSR